MNRSLLLSLLALSLLFVLPACDVGDDDLPDQSDEGATVEKPDTPSVDSVVLYEATFEDEEADAPRWYGLLAIETQKGTRYTKLGPYQGCMAGPAEDGLLMVECFWAGLMNTVTVKQQGDSVVVRNTLQDEGQEGTDSEVLTTVPLGGAEARTSKKGVKTLSLDQLKAKAKGVMEASRPRPDRPNPITGVKLKYTSVAGKDCSLVGEPGTDVYDERCPGFAGYSPVITRAGYASWTPTSFTLDRSGGASDRSELRFSDEILKHDPGQNAGVTDKLIEWRYRKVADGQDAHGLIFRVFGDRSGKGRSKLFVARLEGNYGCIVGTTTSNKEARRIADDMNLRCSGPNTVAAPGGW